MRITEGSTMPARMRRNIVIEKRFDLFLHHPVVQEQRIDGKKRRERE